MSRRRQDSLNERGRVPLGRRLAVTVASALATLAVAVIVVALWGLWSFAAPGPAARQGGQTTVLLRHGATLPEIASQLEDSGVIRSGALFMAAAQVTGAARGLKAGEYAVPSKSSLGEVLSMIRQGKVVRHSVTIPEGLTSAEVMDILMADPILTGSPSPPPEGSILPETYEVQRGESRAAVLQRMTAARDKLLAQLWPRRRAGLPFKTPEDAVILASIVEKETALPAERPRVAAVFVNRLQLGMRLGSDPTVIYAISGGRPLGRGLRQSELMTPSPYNTYLNAGLPPTPICNPGRASIAAVLDPPKTDELYFVANGTGGHSFSSTLEEHERNVAHWRQIEQAQKPQALQQAAPQPVLSTETPQVSVKPPKASPARRHPVRSRRGAKHHESRKRHHGR